MILSNLFMIVALTMTVNGTDMAQEEIPGFEEMPKIDAHAHYFDDMPEFIEMMRRINMRAINICFYQTQPFLLGPAQFIAVNLAKKYHPTFFFASTYDLTRRDQPDYAEKVNDWLDKSFEAGAIMVKLWKEAGMQEKKPDGSYLMPDDPVFDPIYAHLTKRGIPLMTHLADPIDAWLPLDSSSAHYNYYSKNPEWYVYGREGVPSHADIIAARDNILAKHPEIIMIGAHLGSLEHDIDGLAERLDKYPNFYIDVSARTYVLRGMPREKVREFLIKYQDRILYGTDLGRYSDGKEISTEEQLKYAESVESTYRKDYEYYAGKEPGQLALPREVLEKFYYKNAERLMPALILSQK